MSTTIKKISYIFVLIFALFETIALFFIDILNVDTTTTTALSFKFINGLLIGFFTAFLAITIINLFLAILNSKYKRISVFIPSLLNSLFLAFLFVIESLMSPIKHLNLIWGNVIVGAITTPLTLYLILKWYNISKDKIHFIKEKKIAIKGKTIKKTKKVTINNISAGNTALFAGIYEVIALPTMAMLISKGLNLTIIGLIAGLTSIITITIYNRLPEKRKIKLLL
ncbi:hypothetical protein KY313_02655 [Candidatus Woesearchaeota archaeon]|jgi:hypothetical protein|nr:hypothetical protein [Candidatus Woesearchaeota archaeon]